MTRAKWIINRTAVGPAPPKQSQGGEDAPPTDGHHAEALVSMCGAWAGWPHQGSRRGWQQRWM